MSSSVTARLGSTSSAVVSHRFYNSRLRDVYESCTLPTKIAFAASHTISLNTFSESTERRSAWKQTTFNPPSRSLLRTSSLSSPFLALVSTAAEADAPASKRARTLDPLTGPPREGEGLLLKEEPKRKTPFKRVTALDGQLRTFKSKMLAEPHQVVELKRCFSVARSTYNWANSRVREGASKSVITLRTEWRARPPPGWASQSNTRVASSIQEGAIRQLVAAYSSNEAKRKKNPAHQYKVDFRSLRKTPTETIMIDKDVPGSKKKNSTLLRFEHLDTPVISGKKECMLFFGNNLSCVGGIRIRDSVRAIDRMVAEGTRLSETCKIRWDKRVGSFHFIFTYVQPSPEDPDPTFADKRIVATDPGSRAFHTWYSPTSGQFGELLLGGGATIETKCAAIDKLQSRLAKRNGGPACEVRGRTRRQRYCTTRRLSHKLARMKRNLHGWMESAHYDAANFILERFDIVIEPKLGVSDMTQRSTRVMTSQSVRKMLTWSHYKFRERLISASTRYAGRHVIESTEPGTSKTCTNCGSWKKDLGANKTYNCTRCGISVDRDVAGARNNFFSEYGRAVGIGWDGVHHR